jgi:hypothetical protein
MGALSNLFNFTKTNSNDVEISCIYPMHLEYEFFVRTDLMQIYGKILTDCVERTEGIPEDIKPSLWDNCLSSESKKGLISLLSEAMANKAELFLVYQMGVIRKATNSEIEQIKQDYQTQGQSSLGVFCSFRNYSKTDMVKIYSGMEYAVLSSLNKMMNLSNAIQFKMAELRNSVGTVDSGQAVAQARAIATALGNGSDVLIDKLDSIETSKTDMQSTKDSIAFIDAKRSFYLGLPTSYLNGEQTSGIGSTGEADTRAVERGLKSYFVSVLNPVLTALFGITTSFKSQDFRQIGSGLEALKTFELVDNELVSLEDKQRIIRKLFDIELS